MKLTVLYVGHYLILSLELSFRVVPACSISELSGMSIQTSMGICTYLSSSLPKPFSRLVSSTYTKHAVGHRMVGGWLRSGLQPVSPLTHNPNLPPQRPQQPLRAQLSCATHGLHVSLGFQRIGKWCIENGRLALVVSHLRTILVTGTEGYICGGETSQ